MDETWVMRGVIAADDDADALAARTDPEAFARLYQRHRLVVFRYVRARGFGDDDASDLAALAFERALTRIDRYRPGSSGFLPWLLVIARNAAVDAHRRSATAARLGPFRTVGEWGPDPADLVLQDEADRALAARVRSLPPRYREVITLRFAAGLSAREIGEVINRSEAASAKLVSRALAALKEAYRDDVA